MLFLVNLFLSLLALLFIFFLFILIINRYTNRAPSLNSILFLFDLVVVLVLKVVVVAWLVLYVVVVLNTVVVLVLNNVVVNYSFYDRWNFRPSMLSSVTTETKEGFSLIKHPVDDKEFDVSVVYQQGTGYRQQILSSAPINGPELIQQLKNSGVFRCTVIDATPCSVRAINPQISRGIITFDTSYTPPGGARQTIKVILFADYTIRKTPGFKPSMIGFTEIIDVNKDTLNDYKMIYANGEEQYFFLSAAYAIP